VVTFLSGERQGLRDLCRDIKGETYMHLSTMESVGSSIAGLVRYASILMS
jgi:hypothetical protein